jgi:hypothetical protein
MPNALQKQCQPRVRLEVWEKTWTADKIEAEDFPSAELPKDRIFFAKPLIPSFATIAVANTETEPTTANNSYKAYEIRPSYLYSQLRVERGIRMTNQVG